MLKNKVLLEKYLEEKCIYIAADVEISNKIYNYAKEKYNINKGLTSDIICLRVSLGEISEFILFCILDSIEYITKPKEVKIKEFFTEQEISMYKKSTYDIKGIKFPIRFKMIQISFDQWIGKIDIDTLMLLRNAQLINYNVSAQRTMKRIVRGEKEIYRITLNESSVKSITEMYKKEAYIPNTLTLNIPEELDSEFYYDDEANELVINKLEHFDITDGYHRYISACRCFDSDNNFNYPMELRIVNFSENKANMFIYQEDQKTKMKKLDSNSFNLNNAGNIVAEKVNQNPISNIRGKISRNNGLINYGEFAQLINYFYFKNIAKEKEQTRIITTTKEIINKFNILTEYNTDYLSKKYTFKELFIIIYIYKEYSNLDDNKMCKLIDESLKNVNKLNDKKFSSKIPKKSSLNEIENIVKESVENV